MTEIINYRTNGATSNIERFDVYKDFGASAGTERDPFTTLAFGDSGLIISTITDNEATPTVYTSAGSTIETITTLGTFATPTATKCRLKLIDATNNPGKMEIQLVNARYDVTDAKYLDITVYGVADLAVAHMRVFLDTTDGAVLESKIDVIDANVDTRVADGATSLDVTNVDGKVDNAIDGTIPFTSDVNKVNNITVGGSGTTADPWRPA